MPYLSRRRMVSGGMYGFKSPFISFAFVDVLVSLDEANKSVRLTSLENSAVRPMNELRRMSSVPARRMSALSHKMNGGDVSRLYVRCHAVPAKGGLPTMPRARLLTFFESMRPVFSPRGLELQYIMIENTDRIDGRRTQFDSPQYVPVGDMGPDVDEDDASHLGGTVKARAIPLCGELLREITPPKVDGPQNSGGRTP